MVVGGDHSGSQTSSRGERFALARFTWTAPDRLDVEGTFVALRATPDGEPALVVRGAGGWRHLPAVPEGEAPVPRPGEPWHATFAWQEAPTPFDVAQLAFGDDLYVRLPPPTAGDEGDADRVLDVVRVSERDAAPADERPPLGVQVEQLRLETELLAAQERTRELEAAAEGLVAELERARADLSAERERRAVEAERFQQGLAQVRELADRTLAEAEGEVAARREELEAAHEALERQEAELAELRATVDGAAGERQALEAEVAELRATVDSAAGERQALEAELAELRATVDGAAGERQALEAELAELRAQVAALDGARTLAAEARTGARAVLDRLDAMADALDGHAGG